MARQRSRYAPDAQVRRVARLAAELGITVSALQVGGDGSVTITGTAPGAGRAAENEAEEALGTWETEQSLVRRP